jgi:hypothetical protein
MATKIYDASTICLFDGTEIELTPLKIKYLRQFMTSFEYVKQAKNDYEAIGSLLDCATVCMKQYYPQIKTSEELEDNVDLPTIYKILDIAAGIKIDAEAEEESVKKQAVESGSTWETLDLAKLESDVFLLGIWKDYDELERSLSMPELIATLETKREVDYEDKKFLAAIQGVDLDEDSKKQDPWEAMKTRVFSGGATSDPNDILAYQGVNASRNGFGIGQGLSYEKWD